MDVRTLGSVRSVTRVQRIQSCSSYSLTQCQCVVQVDRSATRRSRGRCGGPAKRPLTMSSTRIGPRRTSRLEIGGEPRSASLNRYENYKGSGISPAPKPPSVSRRCRWSNVFAASLSARLCYSEVGRSAQMSRSRDAMPRNLMYKLVISRRYVSEQVIKADKGKVLRFIQGPGGGER